MRYACKLALISCPAVLGLAQTPAMPSISTPKEAGSASLVKLQDLRIEVKVVGNLATTTWDMVIRNETNRIVEGSLEFPLAEGQTISRFAMDVNGVLREGVVVEKAKGRQVFESIVRRGVDPGLLEKTEGNNFRARVYPIPASGIKRVVIAYEQEIQARSTGDGLFYQLPLQFKDAVRHFELKVDVLQQKLQPQLKSRSTGFGFQSMGQGWHGETRLSNYVPNQTLEFTLPAPADSESVFFQKEGERKYFCANVNIEAPRLPKALPQSLVVAWDASASAKKRDRARELDVLETYLKRIGACRVELVVFRNRAEAPKTFLIQDGHTADLRRFIEALPLDGGTQLGCLDLHQLKAEEILLFSDGLSNFGKRDPILISNCALIALNSAASAHASLLRRVPEGSGGQFIDLSRMKTEQALEALTHRQLSFLGCSGAPGDIHEVYPSRGSRLQGPFILTGLQVRDRSEITLKFGYGGKVSTTRKLVIESHKAPTEANVARIWAQKKLAELQLDPEANAEEILALGKAHNIVTDGTSLIVLETLQDHITYRIPPPAEWRDQYEQAIQQQDRFQKGLLQGRMDQVWSQFRPLKEWWDLNIKTPEKEPVPSQASPNRNVTGSLSGVIASVDGAPIQNAWITLESPSLAQPLTFQTDANGNYHTLAIPTGVYTIKVGAPGKLSRTAHDVRVTGSSNLNLSFNLRNPGGLESATVEVVSPRPAEAKTDDKVAVNYSAEQLMQLPSGSNVSGAITLAPGVTGYDNGAQVRGSGSNQIMYRIDGIDVKDSSSSALYTPLADSIEDVQVVQSELNARNGGPEIIAQRRQEREAANRNASASIRSAGSSASSSAAASIQPPTPLENPAYLKAMREVSPAERYEAYLNLREAYGHKSAFYLDMADLFEEWKEHELALRVISNLAELKLEDAPLMRILGHRLEQMNELKLAIGIFEKVLKMREEEAQSFRDLALALEADGQYQRSFDLMCKVLEKTWDGRFPEIENIVLEELNALASRHSVDTSKLDPRLLSPMPVDIRVVLNWDTDNSDMDLWVTDPNGEKCDYSHNRTLLGGQLSRDFTQGYGPEVFMIKNAKPGTYRIQANYYGTRQQTADIGPTTLHAELYTNYGTRHQERKDITLRLEARGSLIEVGKIEIP